MTRAPERAVVAVLMTLAASGSCFAFQSIPLQGGTYCGPEDAKIVVDTGSDTVTIEGVVCSFPLIAGDHLQSEVCSTPEGVSQKRIFDLHVVGKTFYHDGAWYRPCVTLAP